MQHWCYFWRLGVEQREALMLCTIIYIIYQAATNYFWWFVFVSLDASHEQYSHWKVRNRDRARRRIVGCARKDWWSFKISERVFPNDQTGIHWRRQGRGGARGCNGWMETWYYEQEGERGGSSVSRETLDILKFQFSLQSISYSSNRINNDTATKCVYSRRRLRSSIRCWRKVSM